MSYQSIAPRRMENANLMWHMEQAALLQGISGNELETIITLSKESLFGPGEIMFCQGDPADTLYIVNRGTVLLTVENATGRRKILNILRNGDIFGEHLLSNPPQHPMTAVAYEESWICTLSRDQLLRLLRENPALSRNLLQIILARLDEARIQIETLSLMNTEKRLASVLVRLAENLGRPDRFRAEVVKLKVKIPHQQLAELVGANRPHISTMLSRFKKNGWINYQNQKLVIDTAALRERVLEGELARGRHSLNPSPGIQGEDGRLHDA